MVQQNALVNARFIFSTLETRLFLALLLRISRGDTTFALCRIPIKELAPDSHSNTLYAEVDEMAKKLASRVPHIEVLEPNGERIKQPDRMNRPLMYQCDYVKSEAVVEARFQQRGPEVSARPAPQLYPSPVAAAAAAAADTQRGLAPDLLVGEGIRPTEQDAQGNNCHRVACWA